VQRANALLADPSTTLFSRLSTALDKFVCISYKLLKPLVTWVFATSRPYERRFRGEAKTHRARDPHRGPANAFAPARCRQQAVQGARADGGFDRRDCGGGRRLSEPDHLLLSHQGSAVRRSGLPRRALRGARRRATSGQAALPVGLHACAGRQRDGSGRRRLLRRGDDAHPPAPGSGAAGGADGRTAARRRLARLCGRDGGARLAVAARSRNQRATLLDHRDRRHAGRPGDGPLACGSRRRDAAPARPAGRHTA
jgi:hypothetical protein